LDHHRQAADGAAGLEAFHPEHQVRLGLDGPIAADGPAADVADQPIELTADAPSVPILGLGLDAAPQPEQPLALGLAPAPDVRPLALVGGRREFVHLAWRRGVLVVL